MSISDNKTRTLLTIKKEDKKKLEEISKKQNRSLNNLLETIITEYLNKQ